MSIKAMPMSLVLEGGSGKSFLLNLTDCPGMCKSFLLNLINCPYACVCVCKPFLLNLTDCPGMCV
jgi:hypothetical protein